ncbi:chitinase-3-like protein 1 [Phtheirospermum japonicum]|uniref:Chitinase-3-like protein 1 n=1 Tax=Phtheirospermum japonicum TaxID=374723 RepID=A0A830BEB5_9LAMI|nr:chitinase-3-like protein 1 [Phtheirospermum japonicum]
MEATVINILCRPSAIFLILISACFHATASSQATIKGAYYPSWAQDTISPSSINTKLFTHIYFAFLTPNNVTFSLDHDIQPAQALFLSNFTSTLKPHVQTLFSVIGNSSLLARMAADPSSRAAFIRSSIQVARRLGFDGVDLDWEYPQFRADMDNLCHLLDEWRVEVQKEAAATGRPPLLLTAAVYYSPVISWPRVRSYPAAAVRKNLDWVNVMNYDYVGWWDRPLVTGAHAALFDPRSNVSTSYGLGAWIRAGVPRGKLVMGLPLYGRSWQLEDPTRSRGIGAPAVGRGPGEGELTYADVVRFNKQNRADVVYNSETVSVYSVAGSSWIGYDDAKSVAVKIGYAQRLGLRGYYFWTVVGDNNWEISERVMASVRDERLLALSMKNDNGI